MLKTNKPKRRGSVQIHPPVIPTTSWLVRDNRAKTGLHLGIVLGHDAEDALALARKRWPEDAATLEATAFLDYLEQATPGEHDSGGDARPAAYGEAAFAVCLHDFGYTIADVMLVPAWRVVEASGKLEVSLSGETEVADLPNRELLLRPEHRRHAGHYLAAAVAGSIVKSRLQPTRPFRPKSRPLPHLRDLLEAHGEDRPENSMDRLYAEAESLLSGPARQQIKRVAEALLRDDALSGDEFRACLCGRNHLEPFPAGDPVPRHSVSPTRQYFRPRTATRAA